jgi:hypothetical protein
MVVNIYNPRTRKAEAKGPRCCNQLGLNNKILSKKQKKIEYRRTGTICMGVKAGEFTLENCNSRNISIKTNVSLSARSIKFLPRGGDRKLVSDEKSRGYNKRL